MTVRVQHDCYVVPGIGDLVVAIVRRRYSPLEACLLVQLCLVLLVLGTWWAAIIVPLSALVIDWAVSARTRALVGSWRTARSRRRALNDADRRDERRHALARHLTELTQQADRAWRVYLADAVTGKKQSIINERPLPKLAALQRLADVRTDAGRFGIVLEEDAADPSPDRLTVPPADEFAPDTLSPTMMNLNAAAIAHAASEGPARAQRRHRQAIEFAGVFGPQLSFAERAAEALTRPPSDATATGRRWPWRRRDGRGATDDLPAIG